MNYRFPATILPARPTVYFAGPIIRLLEDRKMVKGPVLFVCVENVGQSQMGGLSPEILGSMHGIQGVSLVVAIECSI